MLHDFLSTNRNALIDRCSLMAAQRAAPKITSAELEHGIPLFLDQLIRTLKSEQTIDPSKSLKISGPPGGQGSGQYEMGASATQHGRELLKQGFNIDQVVHGYGDLCQSITAMACELRADIEVSEFQTLNRCLDNAIADAVTEYSYHRDAAMLGKGSQTADERLRGLANEQRSLVRTATHAMTAIKAGNVGLNGATGSILELSLASLQKLLDRFLAGVAVKTAFPERHKLIYLADFIADVQISIEDEARNKDCSFTVREVDTDLAVVADPDMLFTAVGMLLLNAFKFSAHHSEVVLNAYPVGPRIIIRIEGSCGNLPAGASDLMMTTTQPEVANKVGLDLGLSICRRSVEANHGSLTLLDLPNSGCVFTIEMPRHLPSLA